MNKKSPIHVNSPFLSRPELDKCTVTPIAINWLSEDGMVHSISLPNELSLDAIEEHFQSIEELTGGTPRPFIIDPKLSSMQITAASRKLLASKIERNISCAAFVIDQKFLTLAINIFFRMRKSEVPVKCFSDTTLAKEWLNKQQQGASQKAQQNMRKVEQKNA